MSLAPNKAQNRAARSRADGTDAGPRPETILSYKPIFNEALLKNTLGGANLVNIEPKAAVW